MENMRLTPIVSKVILKEVSQRVMKDLIAKFSTQTKDSEKIIKSIITNFEKYKEGLDIDKRDITRYNYDELKALVVGKEMEKAASTGFSKLRKEWDAINKKKSAEESSKYRYEASVLKNLVTKFYDIYPFLDKKEREITKYNYLELTELINKKYDSLMLKAVMDKLSKDPGFIETRGNDETLLFYIQSYLENRHRVPRGTKPLIMMTFHELEQLVDGTLAQTDESASKYKQDYSGIDIVYDKNNLLVFAPKTKDQCVRLKNGRSWCTSREGSGNLYYNYRLGHERTLYYVIDQDKPFSDLNHAVVILVNPNGRMSLADGSNSGRYSGHENIPWSEIETKIPKLKGLEGLFEPKPLTSEERELINRVRGIRVGDNPMQELGDERTVEMWMEYNSPRLSDEQFANITPELQKKYIALGFDLTIPQLRAASQGVLTYYVNKKKEKLANTPFDKLSEEDIELLSTPMMKKLKDDLKEKFAGSLVKETSAGVSISLDFPSSPGAKYIALYGFDEFFKFVPKNIDKIEITGKGRAFPIPDSIGELENISGLHLSDIISEIPESICKLKKLRYLSLPNNKELKTLPNCLVDLPNLKLMNIQNTPNLTMPPGLEEKMRVLTR